MEKQSRSLKVACIQLKVGADKATNVKRALEKITEAHRHGAELIILPGQAFTAITVSIFKCANYNLQNASIHRTV